MALWNKEENKPKMHPDYPKDLPMGVRLPGLLTVEEAYWLLNDGQVGTTHPGANLAVKAVCKFGLFGLNIFRAYLDKTMDRFHQIHVADDGTVLDGILFQLVDTVRPAKGDDWKNWLENLIGWKDITYPDGPTFARDWKSEGDGYGEYVEPEEIVLKLFTDMDEPPKDHFVKCMLFSREFDDDRWEYLLLSAIINGNDPRVQIHLGAEIPLDNMKYV